MENSLLVRLQLLVWGPILEAQCIFENKPPPQSGLCILLKKWEGGAYFREDMVLYPFTNDNLGCAYVSLSI